MTNQQNNLLNYTVQIISKLQNKTIEGDYTLGSIQISNDNILALEYLYQEKLLEIYVIGKIKVSIEIEDLKNYVDHIIDVELKTGNVSNFYNSVEDFISGNKFKCNLKDFYIDEIDYRENSGNNIIIDTYKNNLIIIDFLICLSENKDKNDNQQNLFFYKSGKAVDLKIDYEITKLSQLNLQIDQNFKDEFTSSFNKDDKRLLFVNELIMYIERNGNSYIKLVENWQNVVNFYEKSYSLFISGFSFEKIKTSSNEHFQKLVDRIYETIGKASNYIFGIPLGYILLINNFDYSGILWLKNIFLLILGLIFFVMIWFILFKNIDESIESIKLEIDDFLIKIKNEPELDEIHKKLNTLKNSTLKKQTFKLNTVKILTSIVLIIIIIIYLFIFFDLTIFL